MKSSFKTKDIVPHSDLFGPVNTASILSIVDINMQLTLHPHMELTNYSILILICSVNSILICLDQLTLHPYMEVNMDWLLLMITADGHGLNS